MPRFLILFFCLAGLASAQAPRAGGKSQPVDRVVAVVNDEVITLVELQTRLEMAVGQLRRQGTSLLPREVLERQMLDRLVMEKVQLQVAKDVGLRIDDVQLEQALQRIAAGKLDVAGTVS